MRTLSGTLIAELGLTVTNPGYLVSMDFNTPRYWSTLGDVTWGGHDWVATDVKVGELSRDLSANKTANISLANYDGVMGTLVDTEKVGDRAVLIYAVYAGAPTEAQLEFGGVGDAAEIDARVSISFVGQSTARAFSPRRRIGPATGFTVLMPAGSVLTIGNEKYVLERG